MKCEFCSVSDDKVVNQMRPEMPTLNAHPECFARSKSNDRGLREHYIRAGIIRPVGWPTPTPSGANGAFPIKVG